MQKHNLYVCSICGGNHAPQPITLYPLAIGPSINANPYRAGTADGLLGRRYANLWRANRQWRKAWRYHWGYRHGQYLNQRNSAALQSRILPSAF